MIKIAITGNIAAGKSEAEKILSKHNFPVIDTDKITHSLLENSVSVKEQIITVFKNYDIQNENGLIDRKKLGRIVFENNELLKQLENVIHPAVFEEINGFFERNKDKNAVFVSIPLLYEINCTYLFDKVILIYADDKIRRKRLVENRKFTEEDASRRMNAQISQEEKAKSADFVVYNNSDLKNFSSQVESVIKNISKI